MKLDRGSQATLSYESEGLIIGGSPLFKCLGGAVASLSNPPSPTG